MKPRLLAILVASLFLAAPLALAQGLTWTGSASLGLRHTNDNARDPSKLNEYRDLDSSVIGNIDLRVQSDDYHFNGFIENPGRDDLYIDLRGGKLGVFKYQFYNNELRHNFGSGPGARSPYAGIGGPVLTAPFAAANSPTRDPSTWGGFDHSYERRDTGGMLEISANSPWYVRFEGNEVARKGINVLAAANGTSPGNGFVDLPAPVDYKTRNGSVEVGYQGQASHFAANFHYSKFENDNQLLMWSNPFFSPGNTLLRDTTYLPPENEQWKIGLNGNIRKLALDSTLAGRYTYTKTTSSAVMQPTQLGPNNAVVPAAAANVGTFPATGASSSVFDGEVVYQTLSLSLSSHPTHEIDTRLYYNWAKEDNNSTRMVFTPFAPAVAGNSASGGSLLGGAASNCSSAGSVTGAPPFGNVPCTPELFGYRKHNLGIEAGWRVNRENKLTGGYDYYDIERDRFDFHGNKDHKFYAEWKNTSIEELTARAKYQYLSRDSDWNVSSAVTSFNPTEYYVRRYDLANVNQNLGKIVLDWSPRPFLDFGFEAIYKKNDYKDTPLGRTDDKRQEYYLSASFGDPNSFRVLAFFDIEFLQYNSTHRVGGSTLANSDPAAPPSGAPTSGVYTWKAKNEDKAWQIGLGAEWKPLDRLSLTGSLTYAETDGTTDFSAQTGTVLAPPFFYPINNFDNTERWALNLKATYKVDKNWSFTGGYAYERYKYSDIGYDGTQYVVPPLTTSASYVTGQYSFQPYRANIFYLVGTYKF